MAWEWAWPGLSCREGSPYTSRNVRLGWLLGPAASVPWWDPRGSRSRGKRPSSLASQRTSATRGLPGTAHGPLVCSQRRESKSWTPEEDPAPVLPRSPSPHRGAPSSKPIQPPVQREEAGAGTGGTCLSVTTKGGIIPIGHGETEAQSSDTDLSGTTSGSVARPGGKPRCASCGLSPALGVSSLSLLFLS